jgi:LuxR family maltose regulon positive regulatory protein
MVAPILVTKLYIPSTRPDLVPRGRLIKRLNGGLGRKLTLISAPAGFGKTTLAAEWLDSLQGDLQKGPRMVYRIGWISLDETDNDLARFLRYFIAAFDQADGGEVSFGKDVLGMLGSPQPLPVETLLTPLINQIAAFPDEVVCILDDYHLIEAKPIHDATSFLLENMPPQMHLVIATREDPDLPLSRLRAQGQMAELRAADLLFTTSEATEFLNRAMGLDLSAQDIAVLERRTEGWIAGLQLAAISLQGREDTTSFIQSFAGSNRLVLDYLIEEVLERQPGSIQDFLLQTAVLDRLCGPLCDAVRFGKTDIPDEQERSQSILERLERANLFVLPLDEERRWYRYHHLFADLLRGQLRLRPVRPAGLSPAAGMEGDRKAWIAELHLRASQWYERGGFADEAVHHALQAEAFERSAALIDELADPLWKRGEHVKLRRWLGKLPEEWLCSQPRLCLYHAWFLFSTGLQGAAQKFLQVAENTIDAPTDHLSEKDSMPASPPGSEAIILRGRLGAIWSLISTWEEDLPGIIRHAGLALEYLSPGDPWRSLAAMALGDAVYYQGDVRAAYQTRLEALAASRAEEDLFFYMVANLKVATSLREMGKLNEAIEICQQQLDFAKEHGLSQTIFVGWALTLWAVALAEQNELEQALEFAQKSLALNRGGDFAFLGFSYIVLAKIHFYRREYEEAEATLEEMAQIHQTHYLPFHIAGSMVGWQARLMLAQNRLEAAARWIAAQDCEGDEKTLITYDHVIVVRARLLLAQGKLNEAASLLERLGRACEAARHTARLIEILVLQALTHQAAGDMSLAHQYLARALSLAEPGGFVRVFLDEGPPMARLLLKAGSRGSSANFAQELLRAFPQDEPGELTGPGSPKDEAGLFEALSEREIEVLELIAEGLTNREIASRLYLSLNTVKAHTRTIYSKLDVSSRTQAVARGRALGILTTDEAPGS